MTGTAGRPWSYQDGLQYECVHAEGRVVELEVVKLTK